MGQQIVNPDLQRGGHDWQPVLQSGKKKHRNHPNCS